MCAFFLYCSIDVYLPKVEVRGGDLKHAIIYQKGHHGQVMDDKKLAPSQYVRLGIIEWATQFGLTAARIKRRLYKQVASLYLRTEISSGLQSVYNSMDVPTFRRHSGTEVDNIVQNIRKSQRIDVDPLKCIGIFAAHNKDSCFGYVFLASYKYRELLNRLL